MEDAGIGAKIGVLGSEPHRFVAGYGLLFTFAMRYKTHSMSRRSTMTSQCHCMTFVQVEWETEAISHNLLAAFCRSWMKISGLLALRCCLIDSPVPRAPTWDDIFNAMPRVKPPNTSQLSDRGCDSYGLCQVRRRCGSSTSSSIYTEL